MPDWCVNSRCIECESHAIVKGKLDCNYMGRLGLSQPTVKTFLETELTPEKIDAQIKELEEQTSLMEEKKKKLKELKGKAGGESVA